jgi:Putative prokaryotic signal transducing protein
MTRLLAPRDENELMMLRSVLECEGISYQIQNEHFGGLYPGLNIFALNERIILVDEADYERAWVVARDFLKAVAKTSTAEPAKGSISTIHRPDCFPRNTDTGA